jgi:hypothetical protein
LGPIIFFFYLFKQILLEYLMIKYLVEVVYFTIEILYNGILS